MDDRVFEVAFFWRLDPAEVMQLPLQKFELYELQGVRLAKEMRKNNV